MMAEKSREFARRIQPRLDVLVQRHRQKLKEDIKDTNRKDRYPHPKERGPS